MDSEINTLRRELEHEKACWREMIDALRRERDELRRQVELAINGMHEAEALAISHEGHIAILEARLAIATEALKEIAGGDSGWLEIADEALAKLEEGSDGQAT